MKEYLNSALLAISAVKVAELASFLPAPETAAQAAILALVTGFLGGLGRWTFDRVKRKIKL